MSDRKYVSEIFSKIPAIWYIKDNSKKFDYVFSLFQFLKKNKYQVTVDYDQRPRDIPYNNSIFHFLLYYCYYPRYPFVVFKKNTLIFGAFTDNKFKHAEFSFPVYKDAETALNQLDNLLASSEFESILKKFSTKQILLRDITDNFVNKLRKNSEKYKFYLESIKELNYSVYDIKETLNLSGTEYANLRWHINSFVKKDYKVEEVPLSDSVKPVIHLIGKWRKKATKDRGFSFVNVRSDKLGARLFGDFKKYLSENNKIVSPNSVLSKVLKVNGEVASFNLGFPLGIYKKQKLFAHAIGISDLSISHLAEYAQFDFWKFVKKKGYRYINDGPTWKKDLQIYKNKFRPITKKRLYWATIKR